MKELSRCDCLYCPLCHYNLTGLAKNRCPECGTEFEPEEIQRLIDELPKPMSNAGLVLLFAWPIIAMPVLLELSNYTQLETFFLLLVCLTVVGIPVNSGVFVHRILASIRIRTQKNPFYEFGTGIQIITFVATFVLQSAAVIAGIYVAHTIHR